MFAALEIPAFALQAVLRHEAGAWSHRPAALVADLAQGGEARLLEVTPAARAAGVDPGLTATQGQARCAGLRVLRRDAEAERHARDALLQLAGGVSARVEDTAPGRCALDLGGTPFAAGCHDIVRKQLLSGLAALGFSGASGVAGTPDLALVAARLVPDGGVVRDPGRDLVALPLERAGLDAALLPVLAAWGVREVGAFLALPSAGLAERLGAAAVRARAVLTGARERPLAVVMLPERYAESVELEHPVEQLEPVLFLLRRAMESLAARLESTHRVAVLLRLRLGFDDRTWHARDFPLPRPTAEVERWFRVVLSHLEGLTAPSAVGALELEAVPGRASQRQRLLFDPGLRDPERFADTLARLAALVGPDRVGTPVLDDAHGDESFQLTSAAAEPLVLRETPARFGEAQPRERPVSALRRVRPPWEARVTLRDGRPEQVTAGGVTARVTDCAGPWRSSGRWWESPPWWREEWDILWNGAAHRLVRTPAGWRVEGVYD